MKMSIQTTEKTFNKKVKEQVAKLMPTAKRINKQHVAGIGYVNYIEDINGNTIGKVFKEFKKGMMIYVD